MIVVNQEKSDCFYYTVAVGNKILSHVSYTSLDTNFS